MDKNDGPIRTLDRESLGVIENNIAKVKASITKNFDVYLEFDQASIDWIDAYIETFRLELDGGVQDTLISLFGSFFGEALTHEYGGEWVTVDEVLAVQLQDEIIIFPFARVAKQFSEGGDNSIACLYKTMFTVLAHYQEEG